MKKRHGDVGLILTDTLPPTAKLLDRTICRCAQFQVCAKHLVLAHGEVSGHAHRFDFENADILIYEDQDGTIHLVNKGEAATLAQTQGCQGAMDIDQLATCYQAEGLHAPIREALPAGGVARIVFPREYDWFSGEIHRARD